MGSCTRRRWRGAHAVPPQPFQQRAAGLFGADPAVFGKVPLPVPGFQGHGRTRCGSLAWNSCMITDDMAGVLDVLAFCVNVCLDTAAVHMRDAIWRRSTLKR